MIALNEDIKKITITEDTYVNGQYTLDIKDCTTPQKYLIDVENVQHKDGTLIVNFYQPIIPVPSWGIDSLTALDGLDAGYGYPEVADITFKAGSTYSISIFNGVVVYGYGQLAM